MKLNPPHQKNLIKSIKMKQRQQKAQSDKIYKVLRKLKKDKAATLK